MASLPMFRRRSVGYALSRRGTRAVSDREGWMIMESRLKLLGHPIHPMLVMFPLGLFVTAVIFDFADLVGGPAVLGEVGYWNIVAGLIGGVLAALVGLVDYLAIPAGTRAKRVGLAHAAINAGV